MSFEIGHEGSDAVVKRRVSMPTSRLALLVITAALTVAFLEVASPFLAALILAAIGSVLVHPVFAWFLVRAGERKALASILTILVGTLVLVVPLLVVSVFAARQSAGIVEAIQNLYVVAADQVSGFADDGSDLPQWLPFRERIIAMVPEIAERLSGFVGTAAGFLGTTLANLTSSTARLILSLFTFLYATFYLLQLERPVLEQILARTGLSPSAQSAFNVRIISISRATLRGTLVIGIVQAAMGALGFWLAGIGGVAFWGVVMFLASVIPAMGAPVIIVSGALWLAMLGEYGTATLLAAWGVIVVSMVDNLLRPILVGRETEMPDILVFVGTLGGLSAFGASGLVFGPIITGLFLTAWDLLSTPTLSNDINGTA